MTDEIETFTPTGIRLRSGAGTGGRSGGHRDRPANGCTRQHRADGRRASGGPARHVRLQGHDAERRTEPRLVHRLHQQLVDAPLRPDLAVRLPPAQPPGPHRHQHLCPRDRPSGVRRAARDRWSTCPPATSGAPRPSSPARAPAAPGASARTTPATWSSSASARSPTSRCGSNPLPEQAMRPLGRAAALAPATGHGSRRLRTDVSRDGRMILGSVGLLEDVGGPADDAADREGRREHRARQAAELHHHAGVELDVGVEVAAGLELGEDLDDALLDGGGEVDQVAAEAASDRRAASSSAGPRSGRPRARSP